MVLTTDIITATISALVKLGKEKCSCPKILAVIINIIELITKVNSPKVTILKGRVSSKRIGRITTFKIDKIKLANRAARKVSTYSNCGKNTVIPMKVSIVTIILPR